MQISAEVIKKSMSPDGVALTTFRLTYPRYIHAQLMTHRMLSKNSSSSRAVPVKKMIEYVESDPVIPTHWGANKAGMVAEEEVGGLAQFCAISAWNEAMKSAVGVAKALADLGIHKQVVNRLLEPFSTIQVICSGTEWDNFYSLRIADDAQPEIAKLAQKMKTAQDEAETQHLRYGQWHTPFVDLDTSTSRYYVGGSEVTLYEALMISVSTCAQVSYRKADTSYEKACKVYAMLTGEKPHLTPMEHVAKPFDPSDMEGVTHQSGYVNNGGEWCGEDYWSGNFRGWIQYRHYAI